MPVAARTSTEHGYLAGMDLFTPTLEWGSELTTSLWWIAKAWLIAAVSTLVVVTAIGRFTVWGRQFWGLSPTTPASS